MARTQDGSELLTGPGAGGLLRSAVGNSGGVLHSWSLDHVDHRPGRSTKALYRTMVSWPALDGPEAPAREELFGASAHIGEREKDLYVAEQTLMMTDGDINVRVWRYPHDPWLPMLPLVCYPDVVGRTLSDLGVLLDQDPNAPIRIDVVSYRPGRRAVLRAAGAQRAVFLKVMQPHRAGEIVERHQRLFSAGVPVPEVLAHYEGLVVLAELPGRPLSRAVVEDGADSCRAEDLVALLDRLPASMYTAALRPPWTDSVDFYAGIVSSSVPALAPRLDALVREIRDGLAAVGRRRDLQPHDVVHGDFYEAQVFVEGGRVVGLLDIDTVGPGRRADDLACLLAHLSVLADYGNSGRIDRAMQQRVEGAISRWSEVFRERVDPTELALRAAGVVLSLATGPHRQQEAAWEAATEAIVRVAELWVERARAAEAARAGGPAAAADPVGGAEPAGAVGATGPSSARAATSSPSGAERTSQRAGAAAVTGHAASAGHVVSAQHVLSPTPTVLESRSPAGEPAPADGPGPMSEPAPAGGPAPMSEPGAAGEPAPAGPGGAPAGFEELESTQPTTGRIPTPDGSAPVRPVGPPPLLDPPTGPMPPR